MTTPKIGPDVAAAEFERMCDANRIDRDPALWSDDDADGFAQLRTRILRDMQSGAIVVDDEGRPTYTPPGASKGLTFHKAKGATLIALETHAGTKGISNTLAAMAELTHVDRGEFARMDARDVHACVRLTTLFLADR